ncbi:Prolyl oligopeptidase family protein [Formivibrio citricus]|uniref:Prolyl oligopeptidase family protein n=1 Tax=Formivibrio citricus TaxID=83765 RepID=A0A1I4Z6K2_9NEIS|nr:alpha/beta fold hydrolase [Formivibrio citricus]SFN45643.1 Prolyl oligopeptidase family protein [Formivibrio citricus]
MKAVSALRYYRLLAATLWLALSHFAVAEACKAPDFEQNVSGHEQCLRMRRYGSSAPEVMLVWLHGDVSSGGPADYHFPIARKAAEKFSAANLLSIALVRPGYPDGSGEISTSSEPLRQRYDHYTKENIKEVAAAIQHLRDKFKPGKVIAIGHSGGAATSALIMGMNPGLLDAAVLVACPCNLAQWRSGGGKRPWYNSEDPMKWVNKIDPATHVIALTGRNDSNTFPEIAESYIQALQARKINAEFQILNGENHNNAFRAAEVFDAVQKMIAAKSTRAVHAKAQ